MQNQIKTSVIIPVYNVEEYLNECVQSVLAQTQKEIEIILVDDGSTDSSGIICDNYAKQDARIKVIHQNNKGLGEARNVGARIAQGKYIYFLDSDDIIKPELIEKCYSYCENNTLDFCLFDAEVLMQIADTCDIDDSGQTKVSYDRSCLIDPSLKEGGTVFWTKHFKSNGIYTCAYLHFFNRSFFCNNNLWFIPEIYYEDNDWVARIYVAAKKVMYIPEKLHIRRFRENSIVTAQYSCKHFYSIVTEAIGLNELSFAESDRANIDIYEDMYRGMVLKLKIIADAFKKRDDLKSIEQDAQRWIDYTGTVLEKKFQKSIKSGLITYNVCTYLADLFSLRMEKQDELVRFYAKQLFSPLKLFEATKKVAFYGAGERFNKFWKALQPCKVDITAMICFVDSYKQTGVQFMGYTVYNVADIKDRDIDVVVITSSKYEKEILENLAKYKNEKTEVINVPRFY